MGAWRKGIGDERGSNGGITGFANADDGVTEEQLVVVMHEPGKKGEAAPDKDAEDHDVFAGKAVTHPADHRRGKHVSKEECAGQHADFGVTQVVDANWGVHGTIRKNMFRCD